MIIGTGIYVRDSIAAARLYMDAFGLELGYHVMNPDGGYYHSELCRDGKEVLSVVEIKGEPVPGNLVCLGVDLPDESAVRRAFELLSDGGSVRMPVGPLPWSPCAAEVIDRFGVWWYLTAPQHRPAEGWQPENDA